MHFLAALGVAVGSWLSGVLHPRHQRVHAAPGRSHASRPTARWSSATSAPICSIEWALVQFAHNQAAALVTGHVRRHRRRRVLRAARGSTRAGADVSAHTEPSPAWSRRCSSRFRPETRRPRSSRSYQEPALAAMEGRFETGPMAEITLIGQPNVKERRLDNPIRMPGLLSFLAYGTFHSRRARPGRISARDVADQYRAALLRLPRHGRPRHDLHRADGTGHLQRFRGRLESGRPLLWVLMLAFPFPFIANTAGWMTAELGRQPWLVYGLYRTEAGLQHVVSSGDVLFTLIGMAGTVLRAWPSVSVSDRPRSRARPRSRNSAFTVRRISGSEGHHWLNCGSRSSASC